MSNVGVSLEFNYPRHIFESVKKIQVLEATSRNVESPESMRDERRFVNIKAGKKIRRSRSPGLHDLQRVCYYFTKHMDLMANLSMTLFSVNLFLKIAQVMYGLGRVFEF